MQVGDTVSLRVRTRAGSTEVVGTVLAASPDSLTVRRRDSSVLEIAVTSITASRIVPPAPAQRIGAVDLHRIMSSGWRALESEPLGDWLMRAGRGATRRANSALAVGDPGMPLAAALDTVEAWYDARGLPPQVQLPAPGATDGVLDLARDRGWQPSPDVLVMTAELGPVLRGAARDAGVAVRLDAEPDGAWLSLWRGEWGAPPPADASRAVMTNHPRVVFGSVRDEAGCVAIARASVDDRWAGLFCVEVAPGQRRRGLARAISLAVLRWAVDNGARRAYLQAEADNSAAIALYESMAFAVHHRYRYLSGPPRETYSGSP